MYRIAWKSKFNAEENGCGKYHLTLAEAEKLVKELNSYSPFRHHWYESEDETTTDFTTVTITVKKHYENNLPTCYKCQFHYKIEGSCCNAGHWCSLLDRLFDLDWKYNPVKDCPVHYPSDSGK